MKVLLTGATGVVGSNIRTQLRTLDDLELTCSATRDREDGTLGWRMGIDEPPRILTDTRWDVVVHAAADTRWTQTVEEADGGNLRPAMALEQVTTDETHVIFLSTSHVVGLADAARSTDVGHFRNAYEWSKAQAEMYAEASFPRLSIVRFPMVIGARRTGAVERFSGFYQVLSGLTSGLLPVFVGRADAPVDLVPVDDIGAHVRDLVISAAPSHSIETLGRGDAAPTTTQVIDATFHALNEWRSANGGTPIDEPPLIDPGKWDRFFLPFAEQHLNPIQLQAVRLFSVFHPYMSMAAPFDATHIVEDPLPAFMRSISYWADRRPRAALANPVPWERQVTQKGTG